jgi:hypothetical protein
MHNTIFVIKSINHKQLAQEMGVSPYVLHTWLSPIKQQLGKKSGKNYSLEQMLLIYNHIGLPSITDADGNAYNMKQQLEWQRQLQISVR